MRFRWSPPIRDEWSPCEPLPLWLFAALFLLIECAFLGGTIATWPNGKSVASEDFVRTALVAPFVLWIAISSVLYTSMYENHAFEAAVKNAARWHLLTEWQRNVRAGVAVLDSMILTPEPDLAERMLSLEGSPPENPGKIMRLEIADGENGTSRERAVIEKLLTPLAAQLAQAARGNSFDIVMQCERAESEIHVQAVWADLQLPGKPRIRWLSNDKDPGFADVWFKSDEHASDTLSTFKVNTTPEYRLVVAWHLNDAGPGIPQNASEAAAALLLGSPALMRKKPELKHQAWLLRQIVTDADKVDEALALLIDAEQVPRERIRHFWYSGLKGLALHVTLGAVKDIDLKVEGHALDRAIGPQAPVMRWVLQAMAAKMAQFGQGAQLVALPRSSGVGLNVAVKDAPRVDIPWKDEYEYGLWPGAELVSCMSLWTFVILMSPNKSWGTLETAFTAFIAVVALLCSVWRIFLGPRFYTDYVWREFG
jgi:hypothetical protein